ncbi:MAG: cell division protein SepF [Eubacteriales bacterium]
MNIFSEFKRLSKHEEDEDDYEDFEPLPRSSERRERRPLRETEELSFETASRRDKVVNIKTTTQVQVFIAKPDRFENACDIADQLREKRTVVLNLESTDPDVAKRILNFLAGVAYAIDGQIKNIALSTYVITPYNVDILGDLLDELNKSDIHFNDERF